MVEYLSKFIPILSDISAPLRKLLEEYVQWHWEEEQQKSFTKMKSLLANDSTMKLFDVHKSVMLSVDASSKGIGAVILQDDKLVAYGSRALTDDKKYLHK